MFDSEVLRDDYIANGTTADFNFNFPIYEKSNVAVLDNGIEKVLDTDYTVRSGASAFENLPSTSLPSIGFIRFFNAPGINHAIAIIPKQAAIQKSQYTTEPFPSKRVERDFDKLAMVARALKETIQRTFVLAKKSLIKNIEIEDPVADGFLRYSADGKKVSSSPGIAQLGSLILPVTILNGGTGAVTQGGARAALDVPATGEVVLKTLIVAKGDLFVGTGLGTLARLAKSVVDGKYLKTKDSELTGFEYGDVPAGSTGGATAQGIYGRNNVATPNTQFDLSADFVVLYNPSSGNTILRNTPGVLTNNIASFAAGGRDQAGAFGNNVAIHFYWIDNGIAISTLSSLSPTTPTLPSGYTHLKYAYSVFTDGSGNLKRIYGIGASVFHEPQILLVSGAGVTTEETYNLLTSFLVPANCRLVHIHIIAYSVVNPRLRIVSGGASQWSTVNNGQFVDFVIALPILNQIFYYIQDSTNFRALQLVGYEVPNG